MVKSLSSGMVNFNSNAIIVEILNFFIIFVNCRVGMESE